MRNWIRKQGSYVRANACVKGHPNMTSIDFCRWVNETLLANSTLEPGFPRKICLETACKWLHHLGFEVLTAKKEFLLMDMNVVMLLSLTSSFYGRWWSWGFCTLPMPQLKMQWKPYLMKLTPHQWKAFRNCCFLSWQDYIYCKWRSANTMGNEGRENDEEKEQGSRNHGIGLYWRT